MLARSVMSRRRFLKINPHPFSCYESAPAAGFVVSRERETKCYSLSNISARLSESKPSRSDARRIYCTASLLNFTHDSAMYGGRKNTGKYVTKTLRDRREITARCGYSDRKTRVGRVREIRSGNNMRVTAVVVDTTCCCSVFRTQFFNGHTRKITCV